MTDENQSETHTEEETNDRVASGTAAEQGTPEGSNDEEELEVAPPLPPLMQGVISAIEAELPHLKPEARDDGWVQLNIPADQFSEAMSVLRHHPELNFDYLSMISAVDYKEKGFQVVYHLLSLMANKKLMVAIDINDRENPSVPTVIEIWPTAAYHEREAWDLMGIGFEGHPNLRRILMREDWVGHPLRKDYVDERAPRERVTKETYAAEIQESVQIKD